MAKEAKAAKTAGPVATPAPVMDSNIRPGFSLGVGWPYVGAKYFFNNDLGLEARFATGDGIDVYAARGYWSFLRYGNFSLQTGAEFGYFTFDTMNSNNTLQVSGSGYEIAPLVGLDYFMDRNLSVLIDFSMPVIDLSSHQVSLGDVEWVFEGGVYFYPF
ncbi:MAG TPA: hypothetical protein VHE12_05325 [bacterium]|nr:hypothetical protein [bacterium]